MAYSTKIQSITVCLVENLFLYSLSNEHFSSSKSKSFYYMKTNLHFSEVSSIAHGSERFVDDAEPHIVLNIRPPRISVSVVKKRYE